MRDRQVVARARAKLDDAAREALQVSALLPILLVLVLLVLLLVLMLSVLLLVFLKPLILFTLLLLLIQTSILAVTACPTLRRSKLCLGIFQAICLSPPEDAVLFNSHASCLYCYLCFAVPLTVFARLQILLIFNNILLIFISIVFVFDFVIILIISLIIILITAIEEVSGPLQEASIVSIVLQGHIVVVHTSRMSGAYTEASLTKYRMPFARFRH